MRLGRTLLPLSLLSGAILVLPACSVLEDWGVVAPSASSPADSVEQEPAESAESPDVATTPAPTGEGFALPDCDSLYSSQQNTALLDEVRVSFGDTSEGNFGYGTTHSDLIPLLQNVRSDLRVSCTWVLQASESASVTSAVIITSEVEADVRRVLAGAGGTGEDIGGGFVWTVESPLSEVSPDIDATEVHYLADITCPVSVTGQECVLWVTSNYSFGEARVLTLDAAENMGAFSN